MESVEGKEIARSKNQKYYNLKHVSVHFPNTYPEEPLTAMYEAIKS